jgi:hypothetical protein
VAQTPPWAIVLAILTVIFVVCAAIVWHLYFSH